MRIFDRIRKTFDTGGIRVGLTAPPQFTWADPLVPVQVTLTGHESERRSIQHLNFRLKDVGDGGGPPGLRKDGADRRPDGRIINHSWQQLIALHLAPGETRTLQLQVPLPRHARPGALDRATITSQGVQFSFGTQWFELTVSAPVDGANIARSASTRLRLTG